MVPTHGAVRCFRSLQRVQGLFVRAEGIRLARAVQRDSVSNNNNKAIGLAVVPRVWDLCEPLIVLHPRLHKN